MTADSADPLVQDLRAEIEALRKALDELLMALDGEPPYLFDGYPKLWEPCEKARRALAFRLADPKTGEALFETPPGKDAP